MSELVDGPVVGGVGGWWLVFGGGRMRARLDLPAGVNIEIKIQHN